MTRLVVVCGLPGVGKSTVARDVATRIDGALLRTDAVRKDVRADPRYDAEESRRVYAAILDEARDRLEAGESVVLDGTFRQARHREWARELATAADATFDLLAVECDETVAVERIAERNGDLSDATLETYYELEGTFDPLADDHVVIDNSGSIEETRRQITEWRARAATH